MGPCRFISTDALYPNISAVEFSRIEKSYEKWDSLYWEAVMLLGVVKCGAFGSAHPAAIRRCNRRIRHVGYILSKATKAYTEAKYAVGLRY